MVAGRVMRSMFMVKNGCREGYEVYLWLIMVAGRGMRSKFMVNNGSREGYEEYIL